MTQQLIIKITKIFNPIPQINVPGFFSVKVTTDPATTCRILTIATGATISGIVDPSSTISTIFVPQALYDSILSHALPFRILLTCTLLDNGTLRVDDVAIQGVSPTLLLSVQSDLVTIRLDAEETLEAVNNLLGLVTDALAVRTALISRELAGARENRVSDVAPTMSDAAE